jgi:hypothetical protein
MFEIYHIIAYFSIVVIFTLILPKIRNKLFFFAVLFYALRIFCWTFGNFIYPQSIDIKLIATLVDVILLYFCFLSALEQMEIKRKLLNILMVIVCIIAYVFVFIGGMELSSMNTGQYSTLSIVSTGGLHIMVLLPFFLLLNKMLLDEKINNLFALLFSVIYCIGEFIGFILIEEQLTNGQLYMEIHSVILLILIFISIRNKESVWK